MTCAGATLALNLFVAPTVAADRTATSAACAQNLAPLIDPAKLATLGKRGANPRVQKAVYWLLLLCGAVELSSAGGRYHVGADARDVAPRAEGFVRGLQFAQEVDHHSGTVTLSLIHI